MNFEFIYEYIVTVIVIFFFFLVQHFTKYCASFLLLLVIIDCLNLGVNHVAKPDVISFFDISRE